MSRFMLKQNMLYELVWNEMMAAINTANINETVFMFLGI